MLAVYAVQVAVVEYCGCCCRLQLLLLALLLLLLSAGLLFVAKAVTIAAKEAVTVATKGNLRAARKCIGKAYGQRLFCTAVQLCKSYGGNYRLQLDVNLRDQFSLLLCYSN